jgi:hypothetical protein
LKVNHTECKKNNRKLWDSSMHKLKFWWSDD